MPAKESGKVSISINRKTAEALIKFKQYGETWDELLLRLLRERQEK
jgi:hypothetical protein